MLQDNNDWSRASNLSRGQIIDVQGQIRDQDPLPAPMPYPDEPPPSVPQPYPYPDNGQPTDHYEPRPDYGMPWPPTMVSLAEGARVDNIAGRPIHEFSGIQPGGNGQADPQGIGASTTPSIGIDGAFKSAIGLNRETGVYAERPYEPLKPPVYPTPDLPHPFPIDPQPLPPVGPGKDELPPVGPGQPPIPLPIAPIPKDGPSILPRDWPEIPPYEGDCECDLTVGPNETTAIHGQLKVSVGEPFFLKFILSGSGGVARHTIGWNRQGRTSQHDAMVLYEPATKPDEKTGAGKVADHQFKIRQLPCPGEATYWVVPRLPGTFSVWATWGNMMICEVMVEVAARPPAEEPKEPPVESECKCTHFGMTDEAGQPCGTFNIERSTDRVKCVVTIATEGDPSPFPKYEVKIVDKDGNPSNYVAGVVKSEVVAANPAVHHNPEDGQDRPNHPSSMGRKEPCGSIVRFHISSQEHTEKSAGALAHSKWAGATGSEVVGDTRTGTCTVVGLVNGKECGRAAFKIQRATCRCKLTCPSLCAVGIQLNEPLAGKTDIQALSHDIAPIELELDLIDSRETVDFLIESEKGYLEVASDCEVFTRVYGSKMPARSAWKGTQECNRVKCGQTYSVWVRPAFTIAVLAALMANKEHKLTDKVIVTLSNGERCEREVDILLICDANAARNIAEGSDKSGDDATVSSSVKLVAGRPPGALELEVDVIADVRSVFIPPDCCCLYLAQPLHIDIQARVQSGTGGEVHPMARQRAQDVEDFISSPEFTTKLRTLVGNALKGAAKDFTGGDSSEWPSCSTKSNEECDAGVSVAARTIVGGLEQAIGTFIDERTSLKPTPAECTGPVTYHRTPNVTVVSWIPFYNRLPYSLSANPYGLPPHLNSYSEYAKLGFTDPLWVARLQAMSMVIFDSGNLHPGDRMGDDESLALLKSREFRNFLDTGVQLGCENRNQPCLGITYVSSWVGYTPISYPGHVYKDIPGGPKYFPARVGYSIGFGHHREIYPADGEQLHVVGDCARYRWRDGFRIDGLKNKASGVFIGGWGHAFPRAIVDIDLSVCCDGTYKFNISASELPSHAVYVDGQLVGTRQFGQRYGLYNLLRFYFAGDDVEAPEETLAVIRGQIGGRAWVEKDTFTGRGW